MGQARSSDILINNLITVIYRLYWTWTDDMADLNISALREGPKNQNDTTIQRRHRISGKNDRGTGSCVCGFNLWRVN